MKIQDRIAKARDNARMSQQELAEAIGVTKGAVSHWETGKTLPRHAALEAVAKVTNVSLNWLLIGDDLHDGSQSADQQTEHEILQKNNLENNMSNGQSNHHSKSDLENFHAFHSPNAKILEPINFDRSQRIPVYGQAVGGINGEFEFNGNVLFDVLCPPQLIGVRGAYAVQVAGDSMSPRYEDGEIVYVDPLRRIKKGDYVIAQVMVDAYAAPHAFIKRFCRHNAQELVLEQLNPVTNLRFPHERVVSVHYIALSGDGM